MMSAISGGSIGTLQSTLLQQQVSVSALGRANEAAKQQGQAVVQLLQDEVEANQNDQESGEGRGLDVRA